jgi:antitoxin CptB
MFSSIDSKFSDTDDEFLKKLSPEKKKLYWRAIKRGTKEADLIFGTFAREYLGDMSPEQTRQFADILHCFDQDLMNWINDKSPVPDDINTPLFQRIKSFSPALFIEF